MGVRRAMDIALKAAQETPRPIYTYGPLIHNPSALVLLRARGVEVLERIPERGEGTVIIRAHGVPPEEKERLLRAGFQVLDATCARVVKVQMIVRRHAREGYHCVLIGDPGHPEVIGIMGQAEGRGILVSSEEDIEALPPLDRYIIVAQTTQDRERFLKWSERILASHPGGQVFNTICDSTHKRQVEARRLAQELDAVVVVGGRQSANTRRLAEIVSATGKIAMAIETDEDLDKEALAHFSHVGVTAGASTPNWVTNRVVREIEALPGKHEGVWRRASYRGMRFLLESNLWTAMAGASLAWGAAIILDRPDRLPDAPLMAAGYIFAMHTLNRLLDCEAGQYNDPLRARFLSRNEKPLIAASGLAVAGSLALTWSSGRPAFVLLLALTALGVLYTLPFFPGRRRYKALKDLPGSKTLFVALAWGTVTVLLPTGILPSQSGLEAWSIFGMAAILVYLRSALLEILDVQGDRIVGRETLAILIGESKALRLVRFLALGLFVGAVALPALGWVSWRAAAFVVPALALLGLLIPFSGQRIGQNLRLEFLVEGTFFVLMGAALILHSVFPPV